LKAAVTELAYLNLDLLIERAEPDYRVRVLASPAGESRPVSFRVPFSDLEVENFLLRISRPRGNVRSPRISSPQVTAIKDFGGRLFEAVFPKELRVNLAISQSRADAMDRGLRIRLLFSDCPELSELPWEYLYDREHNRFLCLSDRTPLVRYPEGPDPVRVVPVTPPLRILVVIASPSDLEQLDREQEWSNVTASLSELSQQGRVEVVRLAEPTLSALQRQLRRDTYHIFHFIGHGGFDPNTQGGMLAMEDDHGRARLVAGEDLGTLLHDHRSLRLAVLNSCEGARMDRRDPFSGTAQSLVQQGIPAVVAMQFEITDDAAITFGHVLYEAIADGYPLDAATTDARKAVYADGNLTEWGTPVLYLRAPDGRIFDIQDRPRTVLFSSSEQARREAEERARQEAAHTAAVDAVISRKDDEDDVRSSEQQPDAESSTTDAAPTATPVLIAPAASTQLPGYDADAVAQQDFIGVEDVVDAFSYLIVGRTIEPPLAVGLFGRWGSGKTFLMRAIQRRVNNITRGARESRRPQGEIGVYKRIVQIEFNAWHYVEGNLWASLVDHIFANLRTSADEGGSELERRRSEVSRHLASTREQRDTLDARLVGLKQLQENKEKELMDLERRQRDRLKDVQQLRLSDIAAAAALSDNEKSIVSEALKPLGLPELQESAADASQSLADARDVVSRGQALLAPMRQYGWKWAALLVVAVCLAPLIAFGLENLNVSGVTQAVTAAAGLLSAVALLVRRSVSWTTSALNRIETAEQRVRQRVQGAVSDQAQQIAELEQQIESLRHEQRSVASERDETAAQIRTLEERLEELTPGRLLMQFLEERSASADYRQHLGLTAIVRRDFEQLSRLVADYNAAVTSDATQNKSEGSADFNRVVLYIDDLDRCPPRRVVEVLQAVHLLLSFPIFVVVVAVDPRWLSQSLQSEYRNLLGAVSQSAQSQASAQDYLEKIFQIPFSLAPLDLDARNRFVDELLASEHVLAIDHQFTSAKPPPSIN
jgi:TolA-binding protein